MARYRNNRIISERCVTIDGRFAGVLCKEYIGPTGIPGFVAYAPGRFMWNFWAEEGFDGALGRGHFLTLKEAIEVNPQAQITKAAQ